MNDDANYAFEGLETTVEAPAREMTPYELLMWRTALANAPDALLDYEEAIRSLPMADAIACKWLEQQAEAIPGIYRWGDLQQALLGAASLPREVGLNPGEAAILLGVSRQTILKLIESARIKPRNIGTGDRAHWRWSNEQDLRAWYEQALPQTETTPSAGTRRKRRRRQLPTPAGETLKQALERKRRQKR